MAAHVFTFTPSNSTEEVKVAVLWDEKKLITVVLPKQNNNPRTPAQQTAVDDTINALKATVPDALDKTIIHENKTPGIIRFNGVPEIDESVHNQLHFHMMENMDNWYIAMTQKGESLSKKLGELVEKAVSSTTQISQGNTEDFIDRIKMAIDTINYDLTKTFDPLVIDPNLALPFFRLRDEFIRDRENFDPIKAAKLYKVASQIKHPDTATVTTTLDALMKTLKDEDYKKYEAEKTKIGVKWP